MPRPSKRVVASRRAAAFAAAKRKRRDNPGECEVPDCGRQASAEKPSEEMETDIQVQVNDAEDVLKLEQPAKGWREAERTLAGYSKINAGKAPQSRWYKDKAKKGDSKNTPLKQKYGDISRFFTASTPITREGDKNVVCGSKA